MATVGDNAQGNGSLDEFQRCYHPSWGRHLHRTRPSIGNHEYRTPGAAGYWGYFGSLAGTYPRAWYSYDVGSWHVVALDSNCLVIGCARGSEQEEWLRADLAESGADCTLAYFHHARFSSSRRIQLENFQPVWDALYEHGVDVVLTAHDHVYERHARQSAIGDIRDDFGIRQFIVGTGGHSHARIFALLPSSEVVNNDTYGVIKLTLRPGGYDWKFLPEAGRTFTDEGSGTCHGPPPDRVRPKVTLTRPSDRAVVRGTQTVAGAASDDIGVERVDFLVDQTVLTRDPSPPYGFEWDTTQTPDGLRPFRARAVDAAGNGSDLATVAVVIDNALPETTITRAPPATSRLRTATLGVSSEPGATFECALDGAQLAPCETPIRLDGLLPGRHKFQVRARDAAGNYDPTPAQHVWTIDVKAPTTRLVYSSTARGAGGSAMFRFTSSEKRSTFSCSVDARAWEPCASPFVVERLSAGPHSFRVRAADAAGNVDWSGESRGWTAIRGASGALITGSGAGETLTGTPGNDVIDAGGGNDVVDGLGGNDTILGGSGADRLAGGAGNDTIVGGPGRDRMAGGLGRDVLDARDGELDVVDGGPGRDVARFDRRLDLLRAIERRV